VDVNFSAIMPIKNEEKFLPYSLPALYRLKPDEIIFLFDACDDNSVDVATEIVKKYDPDRKITRIFHVSEESKDWKFRIAYIKRKGLDLASFDTVLINDADTIVSPKIRPYIEQMGYYKHISFYRLDYPVNVRKLSKKAFRFLLFRKGRMGGVNIVSVSAYRQCEDRNKVKNILSGEDSLLRYSIQQKFPVLFVDLTKMPNINLRPRPSLEYQHRVGIQFWDSCKLPFFKVIATGVISLSPYLIKGYIKARYGKIQS
jgi:glycosyltransferase involved in cell wall biosynthesis